MTDLSSFENEIYALKIEYILNAFEYDLQAKANAAIGMMLERVDELVATGEPDHRKAAGARHRPTERSAATEMGGAMVDTQAALREVAAEQGEVVPVAPYFTAGTLMRQAEMDGTTMAEWFKRESPSKWMQGLIREVQKGIEAGWDRHRSATEQASRRLAATAIETGLWSAQHRHDAEQLDGKAIPPRHAPRRKGLRNLRPTRRRDFLWSIQRPTTAPALQVHCSPGSGRVISPIDLWSSGGGLGQHESVGGDGAQLIGTAEPTTKKSEMLQRICGSLKKVS